MNPILIFFTVISGLAAIWYFWDKIKIHCGKIAFKFTSRTTTDSYLDLPDNEFMFLEKISKLPTKNKFLPTSPEEAHLYNSLANYGLFKKQADSSFKPTKKGKMLLRQQ